MRRRRRSDGVRDARGTIFAPTADAVTTKGPAKLLRVDVRTAAGAPDPGTPLKVYAWPSGDDLAEVGLGEKLDVVEIGTATTSSSGVADVALNPSVDLARLASEEGTLDLEVVANEGKADFSSYSFTVATGGKSPDPASADVAQASSAVIDTTTGAAVGTGNQPLNLKLAPVNKPAGVTSPAKSSLLATASGTAASTTAVTTAATVPGEESAESATSETTILTKAPESNPPAEANRESVQANGCLTFGGTRKVKNLGNRWVNVGNIFIGAAGKHMRFSYSGTSESVLGVGVSGSGRYSSFSAQGTRSVERSLNVTFPRYTAPRALYLDTEFRYGKYCRTTRSPGPSYTFIVRAERHEGGSRTRTTSIPSTPAKNCSTYREAGTSSSKRTTKARTWTNGAKLGAEIGIDLSSRTGFSSTAEQRWNFVTAGRLCGTDDSPGGTPRVLVMRAPA